MRILAIKVCLLAVGGAHSDSRFGQGPTPYAKDYSVSFLWVLFIMFMVMAVAWYILTVMGKRRK